jgi:hypothetical protein
MVAFSLFCPSGLSSCSGYSWYFATVGKKKGGAMKIIDKEARDTLKSV